MTDHQISNGTPGSPGCRFLFHRPTPRLAAALLALGLLLLSRDGSDRLLLFSGFLLWTLAFADRWGRPGVLGPRGRAIALTAVAVAAAGIVVSPVPRMAGLIGFDLLFPILLALFAAASLPGRARARLLVLAGASQGVVALAQKLLSPARPSGTFGNPNYAALVMVVGAIVAIDRAVAARPGRVANAAAALACVAGAVATGSKSAFAALAAGTAVWLFRLPGRLRLAPLAALALLLVVPNPLSTRLLHWSSDDRYAFQRPMIWSMAVEAWREHPVAGLGPGGFVGWARRHNRPVETTPTRFSMRPETAHNQVLQTAVDYGLPGLLVLLAASATIAGGLIRSLRSGNPEAWAPAASAACLLPAAGLFPVLESPPLVLILALALSLHRGPAADDPPADDGFAVVARIAVPALLSILLATEALHLAGARLSRPALVRLSAVIPPQNAARWQDLAALLVRRSPPGDPGAFSEALACLDLAARIDPTDPSTPAMRADLILSRLNAGEKDAVLVLSALSSLDAAAALDPRNPFIPFSSGGIRMKVGLVEAARLDLARAVELEPNFVAARRALAEALARAGLAGESAVQARAADALTVRWKDYVPRSPYERLILAVDTPGSSGGSGGGR